MLPAAFITPASSQKDSFAVFRARVNPRGLDTRFTFLVNGFIAGESSGFAGNGVGDVDVFHTIYGLKAGAAHIVVVRAWNQMGSIDSEPYTLITPPSPAGAPSISMLPSADPALLRVEVNPHGQTVALDLRGGLRFGTASGNNPVIIEHAVDGRKPGVLFVRASFLAQPNAPYSSGGIVSPSGNRFDFPIDFPIPTATPKGIAPAVVLDRGGDMWANDTDARLLATIDPWGAITYAEFFLNGKSVGVRYVGSFLGAGKIELYTAGLKPGTDYIFTCKAWNDFGSNTSNSLTFRTTGAPPPGNKPPVGSIPVLRIEPNVESVSSTITASDPEQMGVSIQSYTQGRTGSVVIDGWNVTYTPGPNFAGTDQFYIVLVDDEGATSSITGQVILAGTDDQAGSYDLVVSFNTAPPRPAGRLTLDKSAGGSFTGKLIIYGAEYNLRGSFNSEGVALLDLDRLGMPPMMVTLTTSSRVESERYLYVAIDAAELAAVYIAEGAPIGNLETNSEIAGFQYTAILPMRVAEAETPQGDGFVTGQVSKKGQARFVGKTGDGQPFSFGGRLQRTQKLQVGITVGKNPRDYIQGHLEFSKDDNKTVRGELAWLSFRTTTEHYRKNFTRTLQPMGARYQRKLGLFGEIGGSNSAKLQLIGEDAVALASKNVNLKSKGLTLSTKDSDVVVKVDKRSGIFRGTFTTGSGKRKFTGALVQSFGRGAGMLMLGGPVGAVEILPPASAE